VSALLVERRDDGVGVLTLNRPEVLNALDPALLALLLAELDALRRDDEVGCAVVTGAGRAFCAGADLKAMRGMGADEFAALVRTFRDLAFAVRGLGKPVIAAVNGYALAGGFELACLCDIRLAAEDARLGVADADVNLSPTSGLTWLLPRLVGLGRAKYLALACPLLDGRDAYAIGLVQEAVPGERLLARACELAASIAAKPRLGVALTREGLDRSGETRFEDAVAWELEAEARCFAHPDTEEALAAFAEKRKPEFTGTQSRRR
jgi:enoyl-CoA hydratase/carnithine racemase